MVESPRLPVGRELAEEAGLGVSGRVGVTTLVEDGVTELVVDGGA